MDKLITKIGEYVLIILMIIMTLSLISVLIDAFSTNKIINKKIELISDSFQNVEGIAIKDSSIVKYNDLVSNIDKLDLKNHGLLDSNTILYCSSVKRTNYKKNKCNSKISYYEFS